MGVTFETVSAIDVQVLRTLESSVYIRGHVTVEKTCVYSIQGPKMQKSRLDHK